MNHQNNFATNLTSNVNAGDTTSPLNSIPTVDAPFWLVFDATNINGNYEAVPCSGKTATNVTHTALAHNHTTSEEVRMVIPAEEMNNLSTPNGQVNGTWLSYTPTWTMNGASSNGTKTGGYTQIGKTVHFWAKFLVDGTSNFVGLTSVRVSLPVTASNALNSIQCTGYCYCVNFYPISFITNNSTTTIHPVILDVSGTTVVHADITALKPNSWAINHYIYLAGTYEAA